MHTNIDNLSLIYKIVGLLFTSKNFVILYIIIYKIKEN